jgi:hypothetical protein
MHVMPNLGNGNRSPVIKVPTETEDIEIVVAALADPDAQPPTDAQLARMVPLRTLLKRRRAQKQ